jgi:5-methyltetrahydropteroyltriglutamate--homocysteine methyltransferase
MVSAIAQKPPGVYLSSTGSYPRIGESADFQILRRGISSLDRGERNPADVLDAEHEMTRLAIADQLHAGLEVITDGQIRWYDPISHIAGKLANVHIAGLQRYFDTNFYFRQPVVTGIPARTAPLVAADYSFARNALGHLPTPKHLAGKLSIKPVLTGPYTLARFSLGANASSGSPSSDSASSLESRALAFANALSAEIIALAEIGADLIQIDEPAILKYPQDWKLFEKAVAPLFVAREKAAAKSRRPELALYSYFHDSAPLYEKLIALPFDIIGLDFTYNPNLIDRVVCVGSPKTLGLGLIDGRNTKLENPSDVARQLDRLLTGIQTGRAYLGASCGLEYLPRDRALAKLQLLPKIHAAMKG